MRRGRTSIGQRQSARTQGWVRRDSGSGTVTGGAHELACGIDADIAGSEEAGDFRAHPQIDVGMTAGVEIDEALHDAGVWVQSDEDEESGDVHQRLFAGL